MLECHAVSASLSPLYAIDNIRYRKVRWPGDASGQMGQPGALNGFCRVVGLGFDVDYAAFSIRHLVEVHWDRGCSQYTTGVFASSSEGKSTSESSGEDCLKALQFVMYNLTLAAVQSCISAGDLRGRLCKPLVKMKENGDLVAASKYLRSNYKVDGDEITLTKTGIALLYDEVSENAYDIRLKLTKEVLTIQKQDVVCVSGSDHSANHRTVTLRRQPVGGLGLSIKGGAEHKVPVVISKIFKDQAAEQTGMLFIGDAIIQVNGINVESATHEEVVHLLRNAGDEVTVTVQYLREAPSFLKLPLGSPGPSSDHSSGTSSPLFDSGLHLNGNSTNTAPSSPSSPIANEPKYEKRWLDTLSVPLSMARISRYKTGTDKLRSNAFEVLALDGVSTGILQFYTAQESADWLRAMSTNISDLTLQNMKMANKCCSPSDQVIHMGWVNERLEGADSSQLYKFKFLALKGSSFYIFSTPPVSTLDWVRAEKIYNLCEVLFKIHKLWLVDDCWLQANLYLGIHQDFDLEDQRPYCFSVMVGHGKSHYFNVELGSELAVWEKSFQRAIFLEVQRTGSKTYMCSWQGDTLCFTVDFALGFTCFDSKTKNVLWRFKFSQLKGSSDDGKTRVKLLFQNLDTKQIETKELEFQDLTAVLHCIHSFIAAKVASVDPVFIDSQSIARKYMYSN
ncbi:gamma-2-syntrophin [Corvus cornix cornix]|uniref:gamma-2-syntrophin n=1 Tax=Corvus cornix cornix TaxID=932674 RepID=UPI00194EC187|nr:gamma-2-syntrophin [Corvus cornix cornix]